MQDGYMGVIQALGFQFAPLNWAYCAGQLISIGQQSALFSLLGCEFGGDCRSVFGYPDLRGRTPIGQFQGPGLTNRVIGQMLGQEYFYMSLAQMPTHTHTHSYAGSGGGGSGLPASVEVATVAGNKATPDAGDYLAAVATATGSINTRGFIAQTDIPTGQTAQIGGVSGGGAPGGFDNTQFSIQNAGASSEIGLMQPSLVINYSICVTGNYPSRS
ncbi:phage tail protein [Kordiimonas gwangyangensis]|uniref:phage tail protein n=1 Tax=Kordiimonas gwangyangensis TaxID=288022 RepID=UPI000374162F|nr:tail fiber protein [Kordiimonas gwangyangensis]